ncbi:InlB B-repeat-containing protein [Eggerthella lenta]|uniref:InlB B-repeat-containing protein n=9 Tax=Eggerthella TaxID=84111 RepID=UPI001F30608D|nr:InlB B-repeat-containing protein [Eggerthella lenta]
MLDLKNTFEGKFLAVLMSVVLVMSMTNILAFAGNEGQKDGSKTESAPTDQVVGESDKEAVDEAVQHGESAAAKDADASKTTPSQPLVSTTVDEAVVTFETQNAFVSVKDQLLSGTMLTTELHKELRFAASADTGFELGAITAKNAANADVPVTTQDGVSSIAAEYVDSTLVVSVVAAAVVSDEPEVETTPITSDTKIEPGEADEKGEPEEPKSEEPETDEPEAPVADEDVVEVEADVSNPAFEGYAQAGNVLVKVTAAEGVLPEGATVQATRIERQDVVDAVAERVESQGKVLEDAIAIDVTLLDKDGNEIQPNGALNVCFFDANVEGEEVGVYRVSDDASQVETIGARQADPAVQSFDVDHFTIYVVGTSTKAESYDKAYEVAPGGTVELEASNRSSKYGAWSIEGSGRFVSSNNNKTPTAKVKINENASIGSIVHVSYRSGSSSYDHFYIKVVSSSSTKVAFDLNGGTGTAPKAVEGENYVTLPGQDGFSRNGYEFLGWSTARDASTVTGGSAAAKVYPAGSEYYLEKNTTLYAVWGAVSTNNKNSVKIAIRTDGTIPDEPSIQNAGYRFLTDADTGMIMVPSDWFSPLHTTAGVDNVTPMLTDAFWEYVNGQNIDNRYWNSETEYVQFYVIKWQVDGGVKPYVGATNPGYAWHIDGVVKKKDKVTLTYSGNGPYEGLIPDSTEHVAGEQVAVKGQNWTDASGTSREFSRPGYTFAGWNTQPNGSGDQYNAGETLTMNGNVTLYAQWVPKDKVTINYVALSGGTVEPGHEYLNPDLDDAKGSVAKAKAGYVFGGWYDNEACSDQPVGENERFTPTRSDSGWADGTTYYAKFVAERTAYTVNHYKVNAAHTAATLDNAENLNATTDTVVEATAQTIPGYTYQPLFDENDMKTVASGTVAGDGSLVLNLYYTPDADALAYHANGGQGTMAATEGVTDQVVEVAANGFERAGYAFVGWNTAADGSGQAYAAGAGYALTAGDDALFAQWTPNDGTAYTVNHYKVNAAHTAATLDNAENLNATTDTVVEATAQTIPGYTYQPLFDENDMKTVASGTVAGDGSLVLNLYYTPDADALAYHANGGQGTMAATEGVTDQVVEVAANGFERAGYAFVGWNTAADGSGQAYAAGAGYALTAGDDALFAQWTPNDGTAYTVNHYKVNAAHTAATLDNAENLNATTDAVVEATAQTIPGYTYQPLFDENGMKTVASGTVAGDGSLVLNLYYTPDADALAYHANGGQGTMAATEGVTDQVVEVAANGFERAGYAFVGWNTAADGSGQAYAAGAGYALTAGDDALFAQWTPNDGTAYTVNHYKVNAAHTAATLDNAENLNATTDAVVEATAQTIPGYTYQPLFDENGMKTVASGTVAGDGSLVLNLYYTPDADALAYHANGGQGTMAATEGVTDQVVEVAANGFERAGYAFVGWNTAADGSGQAYAAGAGYALTAGDDALFAQWTPNDGTAYTVNHYKVNAAHTAATLDNAENLNATTDAVVEATAQTIPGYTYQPLFDENGMKTVASGTVAGDGSLVLNLYYTPDADALAYHANGGQGTMAATEGVTDQVVEVAANGFERAGYAFVGWNTAADGSGQAYAAGAGYALTAGDDALFAQWTPNDGTAYTVNHYKVNAAHTAATLDNAENLNATTDAVVEATAQTIPGYTYQPLFDENGMKTVASGTVAGDGSLVLNLYYTPDADALAYHANGGQGTMAATEGVTDQVVEVAANGFERAGYAFVGWNTAADGSGQAYAAGAGYALTAGDDALFAQWTPNDGTAYTVNHYKVNAAHTAATLDNAENLNATTDAVVEATAQTIPGYTYQPLFDENGMKTVASGTVAGDGSLVLNLYYTPDADALAYHANGGQGTMAATEGVTDQVVEVAANGFERAGYAFVGWNTAADGSGQAYAAGAGYALTAGDDALFAQWTANFTDLAATGFEVTYDGGTHIVQISGTILPSDIVEYWSGDTKLAANEFVNVVDSAEVTVKVIRGGQTWTSDPVVAKINPVAVAINVNSDTKVYNADDPVFSGTVSKLVSESDLGEITYGRLAADASKENVGDDITLTAFYTENDNYNVTVINGKLVITPSDENAIVATGITKTYDGRTASIVANAAQPDSTIEYSVDGQSWTAINPVFINVGTYTVQVRATKPNYESVSASADVVVNPATITVTANNQTKIAGETDPELTYTFAGAVNDEIARFAGGLQREAGEEAGVYAINQGDLVLVDNGAFRIANYTLEFASGTFTITAAPVMPPTPPTPPTPPASPTPTPLPTPGAVPPDSPIAPVVTPIVDALQGAAEAVIGDNETPLAEPRETEIGDNGTPLASHDHASCWVHWYIILGIMVTALYGACVALRRGLFSRKLKKYEDGLTGGGDPAPGAPSISDDASAPIAPKGAPAGATLAAGLGE